MARSYRLVDREQPFLLPPSMTDWLPEDHLVWFVIEAVGQLDTAAFHARARLGGVGRRGYDPDMLVMLLVYAMAHGVRSSRQIERLCHTDVAFRIVCAGDVPDHTVLARFRQDHERALGDLLTATLVLAARLGMVGLGVVAFDGVKIAANAAMAANRGEEHLRKLAERYLAGAARVDADEDALFGEARGDEPPPQLRDRSGRRQRIAQALDEIAAAKAAAEAAGQAERAAAEHYTRGACQVICVS
jgi:transposase